MSQLERHVRLFRNGQNQALRIPKEFELQGKEAIIRKVGEKLIIEPLPTKPSLNSLLKTWDNLDIDWPEIEDQPIIVEDVF